LLRRIIFFGRESAVGQSRRINGARCESASPPIGPEFARRSNNGLGQSTESLRDSPLRRATFLRAR
jgi:hypothetical protein